MAPARAPGSPSGALCRQLLLTLAVSGRLDTGPGGRTDRFWREGHLWEQRSVGGEPGGGSWRLGLAAKVQSVGVREGGHKTATWVLRSRRGRGGGCLR